MTIIKASVPRPGRNAGQAWNPRSMDGVIFIDLDKAIIPDRDENGVSMSQDIILNPGDYGVTLYVTAGKSSFSNNTEGETDNEGFVTSFEFNHPGNELEIREFLNYWMGKNIGIMLKYCNKDYADFAGDKCNPMKLQVAQTGNNDGTNSVITVASAGKGDLPAMYYGTIPMEEPLAIIPADADTIDLVGKGQYQLTGSAAAAKITAVENASHNLIFTLLGTKVGTPPIIESGGNFILKDGQDWSALPDSQITFKAFKDGDTSFKYIEQSRY